MQDNPKFAPKVRGWRHLLAAQTYSLAGLKRLMRETAFRHEVLALIICLFLFALVGATAGEFIALVILFLVLCAVEALNTAVEEIIDRISPELSVTGRHAKDLGSFAVFCLLLAGAALVGYVLLSRIAPWL